MTLLEVKSDILTSPTRAPLTSPSLEENPLQYLQDFMYSPHPPPKTSLVPNVGYFLLVHLVQLPTLRPFVPRRLTFMTCIYRVPFPLAWLKWVIPEIGWGEEQRWATVLSFSPSGVGRTCFYWCPVIHQEPGSHWLVTVPSPHPFRPWHRVIHLGSDHTFIEYTIVVSGQLAS